MFEDGARIDDILNVLRRPTLDKDTDKKDPRDARLSDAAVRYESSTPPRDTGMKFDFAAGRTMGGLQ